MTAQHDMADQVRRILVERELPADAASIAAVYRDLFGPGAPERVFSDLGLINAEIFGAGPIQALLDDETVSDVLVHAGGQVWVDRGSGLVRSDVQLGDDVRDNETVARSLAVRLIARGGRRLDENQPCADAVLASGHRIHAAIPPVAIDGTCLSIRTVRPQHFDLAALTASGTLRPEIAVVLKDLLAAGVSLVLSGKTGAGKTTLLAGLIGAMDPALRVVVIEDTSELRPSHPQVVRLQSRPPNLEGAGEISLRQLVRQALRMRPDRIVLGEVRGPEVIDLLVAMNTGHRGGLCTIHANDLADVPARFEALGLLAGIPREAVHALVASAVEVVVHLDRVGGLRRVSEVGIIRASDAGLVDAVSAVRVTGDLVEQGPGYPDLVRYASGGRTG